MQPFLDFSEQSLLPKMSMMTTISGMRRPSPVPPSTHQNTTRPSPKRRAMVSAAMAAQELFRYMDTEDNKHHCQLEGDPRMRRVVDPGNELVQYSLLRSSELCHAACPSLQLLHSHHPL